MCSLTPGEAGGGVKFSTLPLKQPEIPGPGNPLDLIELTCKKKPVGLAK